MSVRIDKTNNTGDKQTEIKMLQQGDNKMPSSGKKWREEIDHLKQALADQNELIRQSHMRWKMRSATHAVAVNQLSSTKAELEESSRLQEQQASHQRELQSMNMQFKQRLSEEQRRIQEISRAEENSRNQVLMKQGWLNGEFSKKPEQVKLQLSINEDDFKKKLSDESTRLKEEHADHEKAVKKQLSDKEENLRSTMAGLCHQWEVRAQQWGQQQRQLEEILEEKEKAGQQLEGASKLEIHHLRENILKLKVSTC